MLYSFSSRYRKKKSKCHINRHCQPRHQQNLKTNHEIIIFLWHRYTVKTEVKKLFLHCALSFEMYNLHPVLWSPNISMHSQTYGENMCTEFWHHDVIDFVYLNTAEQCHHLLIVTLTSALLTSAASKSSVENKKWSPSALDKKHRFYSVMEVLCRRCEWSNTNLKNWLGQLQQKTLVFLHLDLPLLFPLIPGKILTFKLSCQWLHP